MQMIARLGLNCQDVTILTIVAKFPTINKHTKTLRERLSPNAIKIADGLISHTLSENEHVNMFVEYMQRWNRSFGKS